MARKRREASVWLAFQCEAFEALKFCCLRASFGLRELRELRLGI